MAMCKYKLIVKLDPILESETCDQCPFDIKLTNGCFFQNGGFNDIEEKMTNCPLEYCGDDDDANNYEEVNNNKINQAREEVKSLNVEFVETDVGNGQIWF